MSKREFTPEQIELGEKIAAYYESLDENDPANYPTDDETKTQPPLHSIMKTGPHKEPTEEVK